MASQACDVVLQLPANRIERVPDRHIDVFVSMTSVRITARHQLFARHMQLHPDMKLIAMFVMIVGALHGHATRVYPVEELP